MVPAALSDLLCFLTLAIGFSVGAKVWMSEFFSGGFDVEQRALAKLASNQCGVLLWHLKRIPVAAAIYGG